MQLTKLFSEPTSYRVLRATEHAGCEIAFVIDLASHDLYLRKVASGNVTTWFLIIVN